ncbi:MAG: hypothetical protein ACOYZ7_00950 [Chloroflexota bacterium]
MCRCEEFDSDTALRTVFVTPELQIFQDRLPQTALNKQSWVNQTIEFLLRGEVSDKRRLLPFFLTALRDRYPPGDALREAFYTRCIFP